MRSRRHSNLCPDDITQVITVERVDSSLLKLTCFPNKWEYVKVGGVLPMGGDGVKVRLTV